MTVYGSGERQSSHTERPGAVHNLSDDEGYVDTATDEDLLPKDLLARKPKDDFDRGTFVIVDNLPAAPADKLPKLRQMMEKMFAEHAEIVRSHFAYDTSTGAGKGFAFVQLHDIESAHKLVLKLNGRKLDKQHTLICNVCSDIDKFARRIEILRGGAGGAIKARPYNDSGRLLSWLLDKECRDQYYVLAIRADGGQVGTNVTINWNSQLGKPLAEFSRNNWTEYKLRWSPQGRFIATYHDQGICLWGGPKFHQVMRFEHPKVKHCDFSPCERFLLTMSATSAGGETQRILTWDTRTGRMCREFLISDGGIPQWPILRWNFDGSYFARISDIEHLSVFETHKFTLLGGKSLQVDGIRQFSWSPTDNVVACVVPEMAEKPLKVVLYELPSRAELGVKTAVMAKQCHLYWQPNGDHLAAQVERYTKRKQLIPSVPGSAGDGAIAAKIDSAAQQQKEKFLGMYNHIMVFRVREKNLPVDVLELKANVKAFAWDPVAARFCVLHGAYASAAATTAGAAVGGAAAAVVASGGGSGGSGGQCDAVTFYTVAKHGLIEPSIEVKRAATGVHWAPRGQFCVIQCYERGDHVLEFYDVDQQTMMGSGTHTGATDVEWDPTGRYVISWLSHVNCKGAPGFKVWNFQGRLLHEAMVPALDQIKWRPRPPSLLNDEDLRRIRKNMKQFSTKFDELDRAYLSRTGLERQQLRKDLKAAYESWMMTASKRLEADAQLRLELRSTGNKVSGAPSVKTTTDWADGDEDEDEDAPEHMKTELVETLVSVQQQTVQI